LQSSLVRIYVKRKKATIEWPCRPGSFAAAALRLDHVAAMGFNAVQLLPHTEFSGMWGYNPRLMHAVHGPYGTAEEFAFFVEAAHQRGIAVFVDLAGLSLRTTTRTQIRL
jgi:1,4-alpha-glucan branching enzyme